MAFTAQELATQMGNPNLATWADSNLQTQGAMLADYTAYFHGVEQWIQANGGANPFGWNDVTGLTQSTGVQVVLSGPAQRAPFNDAFDDVRTYLNQPGFRLYQAAGAAQRLVNVLSRMS
jgi:hypothetical protein